MEYGEGGALVSTHLFKRRHFIRSIGGTLLALLLRPFTPVSARTPEDPPAAKLVAIPLDQVPALRKIGGFVYVTVKGKSLLLLRPAEKKIVALSPICTHERCTVAYKPERKGIVCPCHGSEYDATGTPTKGPAKKALTRYPAGLKDTQVIVKLP